MTQRGRPRVPADWDGIAPQLTIAQACEHYGLSRGSIQEIERITGTVCRRVLIRPLGLTVKPAKPAGDSNLALMGLALETYRAMLRLGR